MQNVRSKEVIQEEQYAFPYHHIPHFESGGFVSLTRRLPWGLRYLCYLLHVREMVVALAPESVLDIGCGDGVFVGRLPLSIPRRVGVDLSERAIAFAKAFHPECEFRAMDAIDLKEQFAVVTAIEVLEHVPDDSVSAFLSTIHARMRSDGVAIISVPTTVVPVSPKHYRHYTRDLFAAQVAASGTGLRIERVDYVFAKPWWFDALQWWLNNRLFSLEVRPLLQFAWRRIWQRHRYATAADGDQMVVLLRHS